MKPRNIRIVEEKAIFSRGKKKEVENISLTTRCWAIIVCHTHSKAYEALALDDTFTEKKDLGSLPLFRTRVKYNRPPKLFGTYVEFLGNISFMIFAVRILMNPATDARYVQYIEKNQYRRT